MTVRQPPPMCRLCGVRRAESAAWNDNGGPDPTPDQPGQLYGGSTHPTPMRKPPDPGTPGEGDARPEARLPADRTVLLCRNCAPKLQDILSGLQIAGPGNGGTDRGVRFREIDRYDDSRQLERLGAAPAEGEPPKPKIGTGERTPITHRISGLERDLAVFDTEWTSNDPETCKLVSIGIVRLRPDGTGYKAAYTWKPDARIDPDAARIHGVTDETAAALPPFSVYAEAVLEDTADADLAGYNVKNDIVLLEKTLEAVGIRWELKGRAIVDALQLWRLREPRSLTDAHRRFAADRRAGLQAHDAGDDALMTADVLESLMPAGMSAADIDAAADPGRVDPAGKFRKNESGRVVFNFGKHKGRPAADHPEYLQWILRAGFSPSSRRVAGYLLGLSGDGGTPEQSGDPGGEARKTEGTRR